MIAFTEAAAAALLAELKEASLVTPIVLETIRATLGGEERPSFDDFLLAGAEAIDERAWLTWLIRHKGCHRFGPVRLSPNAAHGPLLVPTRDHPLPSNLPYERTTSGVFLTAVLRPDLPVDGYGAAATLRELRQLRDAWRTAQRQWPSTRRSGSTAPAPAASTSGAPKQD